MFIIIILYFTLYLNFLIMENQYLKQSSPGKGGDYIQHEEEGFLLN